MLNINLHAFLATLGRNVRKVMSGSLPLFVMVLVFLSFLSFKATAQTSTLSLDSVINSVERNNLQLKSYEVKAKSYAFAAEATKGWMAPMVGVGTFMTPYPNQMVMSGGDKGSLMFQVEQDIPNPAKQKAQYKSVLSKANTVLAAKEVKLNELKYNARQLYYTWLIAEKKLVVLQSSERIMETMKKVEEIRYPYNQSKLGAVFQTSAKLQEIANMKRMQHSEIAKAKAWLNALMNANAAQDFKIDTAFVPTFTSSAVVDTAKLALSRQDIQQMEFDIQSMQLNIASMKTQAKPDFKLRFDHMSPLGAGMPKAFSVMGMVSIPIAPWSAKMYKNEVKGMRYEVEAMQLEKSAMLQETASMLFGMQQQLALMDKQIVGLELKVLPTLQKVMDVSLLSYRENKASLPEVIAAWEAVVMMQAKVLDEKLKFYLMIADYEKETYR